MQRSNASRFFILALLGLALIFPVFGVPTHVHAIDLGGGGSNNGNLGGGGSNGGDLGGGGSGCSGGTGGLQNPLGSTCDLPALLTAILTFITTKIGPVIVTLMLVYCGFLFVTARGNEENIRTARAALLWTVIGALILLGASALESVITATIGTL